MQTFFTSDIHESHKNIVSLSDRKRVVVQEQHSEWLVEMWNKQAINGDCKIYHCGDYSFSTKYDHIAKFTAQLNGQKFLIKGNHDRSETLNRLVEDKLIQAWYDYKEIKIGEQRAVMFHYPIASWNRQAYGVWHLHGHCVDMKTEILTIDGWKKREEISSNEEIISYNISTGLLEKDKILETIDLDYSGEVIVGDGRSYDFRFTSDHTDLVRNSPIGPVTKTKAKTLLEKNKAWMILAGVNNDNNGTGLSLDELKLYIIIAADGSIKVETNLCRVRIKKTHKIDYITKLLERLNINYNLHESKGYLSFNFYLPVSFNKLNIKGLDKFLLQAKVEEADAVFDAYANSDGYLHGNTLIIYSTKEQEIDILQAMFCQTGYMSNKYSRYHGFGNNLQHQLSVTKRQERSFSGKDLKTEVVENEHFWCVKTKNQTWIMRRNGVTKITGNCHGSYNTKGKILDVGLDSAYNILGEHRMFTEQDIEQHMFKRLVSTVDHHSVKGE